MQKSTPLSDVLFLPTSLFVYDLYNQESRNVLMYSWNLVCCSVSALVIISMFSCSSWCPPDVDQVLVLYRFHGVIVLGVVLSFVMSCP